MRYFAISELLVCIRMSVEAVCDTTPFVNSLSTHLFARRPDVRTSQAIDTLRHEHADAVTELEHRSRTGHAALLAGSGSPNNALLVGAQHANRPHVYRPPLSSGTIPSQEPHPKLRPRPLADERRPFPTLPLDPSHPNDAPAPRPARPLVEGGSRRTERSHTVAPA